MGRLYLWAGVVSLAGYPLAAAQSLGSVGTVEGTVMDPSGAVIAKATVTLMNRLTGFRKNAFTDSSGRFRFSGVPQNPYHLEAEAPGFTKEEQDLSIRSSVPMAVTVSLAVAGSNTSVTVEAHGADLLETVPYAHNDVDREGFGRLPLTSPGSGLSDAITLSSPGVVADSNGLFHPLGDHAQTSFSVDGQPISDQQSKQFSTQIPLNALQSIELISGAPYAEYGDKTSLVVNAVTRSGLGQSKATGSLLLNYGSFGTYGEEATLAWGTPKLGNFLAANVLRSGRFLDTPEFTPLHAIGNNGTVFDRIDYQPNGKDVFHLNLFFARNWFQTPNTWDQELVQQDQKQRALTFNVAPGYQRAFNASTLFTVNGFWRQDQVNYYPSRDLFADLPATIGQTRKLRSSGMRSDVSYVRGIHNVKVGIQYTNTGLAEDTRFGVTDSAFNPVCLDSEGNGVADPGLTDPNGCASAGFSPNPGLLPGLVPFDLTRGGSLLAFRGRQAINQFAFYAQDQITWRGFVVNAGLRVDHYAGPSTDTRLQPRLGVSYHVKPTGTVLRAAYSRTMETPYNENLLLSSSTGLGGLGAGEFGAYGTVPLEPGRRDQYNAGLQQAIGKFLLLDADYFWKFTRNAYDFDTLFNTPITFPISWRKSKIDGVSLRLSTPNLHGFTAYTLMGHTRSRFFGPENGGLVFNSPVNDAVFRIDHDQAFQQTTNARYQFGKRGPWVGFTWRYDSGLVSGAVASLEDALALTGAQQAAIGFFCGSQQATVFSPIASCDTLNWGATRLRIPAEGTANDDHNPPRVAPRNLFDVAIGTDNLRPSHSERFKISAKFTITNLTNNETLYNFLSTFSGTHFVSPRAYTGQIGFSF